MAIFLRGCFWHQHSGCKYAKFPATRSDFRSEKLKGICLRDQRNLAALLGGGLRVLMVWECVVRSDSLNGELINWINEAVCVGEIIGFSDGIVSKDHEQCTRSALQGREEQHYLPDDIAGFDSP